MRIARGLMVCLCVLLLAGDTPPDATKVDTKSLQGVWEVKEVVENEKKIDLKDNRIRIRVEGDKITIIGGNAGENAAQGVKYKLDASTTPRCVDVTLGGILTMEGIYKLDGKRWTMCLSNVGVKERPGEFAGKNNFILVELEKESD